MLHFPEEVVAKGAVSRKDNTEKGTTDEAPNINIMHQFIAHVDNSPFCRVHVVEFLHVEVRKISSQDWDSTPVQQLVHTNEDDQQNRETVSILKDKSELIKQIVRTIASIQMYIIVMCAIRHHTFG